MHCCRCLDCWSGGGCGVFIAPNHQFNRWGRLRSMGVPDSVRCASHVTQLLGFWRFWPFELCLHVAPESPVPYQTGIVHCSVRLWWLLSLLHELSAHCSCGRRLLQPTVALSSRCSTSAPDSPVNYSGAALVKPEGGKFEVVRPWAPDTVRCARPGFTSVSFAPFFLNPNLIFLLVCVGPLAPVEYIN
jgi:hypothetical protein